MFSSRFLVSLLALNLSQLYSASNDSSKAEKYELITVDIPSVQFASFGDMNDGGEGVGLGYTMDNRWQTFAWTAAGVHILATSPAGWSGDIVRPHINNKGIVSVAGWIYEHVHAFRWDQRDGLLDLGTLGGSSYPTAINNRGEIAGYSDTKADNRHAFIWTEAGGMKDLGALGNSISEATGMNDHGQVVGVSNTTPETHAFVWSAKTGMKDLGVVPGYLYSFAYGTNKRGDIYGSLENNQLTRPALFLWTDVSGITLLHPLGSYWSIAAAMNNDGEIVGETRDIPSAASAFIWNKESGVKRLPTLGGAYAAAFSINNHGDIVGYSADTAGLGHSVLWTHKGGDWTIQDLGTKCFARLITDSGLIAGYIDLPPRQLPCLLVAGDIIKRN